MVYAAQASRCVSGSVKWKVPYSLLVSEFFRCLQAWWKLLPMDWGARQLVFTSVIDRWAQETGLWPYWRLFPAPTWCLMSNETASCLTLMLIYVKHCVSLSALVIHTCRIKHDATAQYVHALSVIQRVLSDIFCKQTRCGSHWSRSNLFNTPWSIDLCI